MKRVSLSLIVFLSSFVTMAQLPYVDICTRVENYYYGKSWVDQYYSECTGSGDCTMSSVSWNTYNYGPSIVARFYDIDTPLIVVGVAAPVCININGVSDTSMSNRLPEYFYIYDITDTGIYYMDRTRWDTSTPEFTMKFRNYSYEVNVYGDYYNVYSYFPVYEAYFKSPFYVTDSFFVGGSINNFVGLNHPETHYIRWYNLHPYPCGLNGGADWKDWVKFTDEELAQNHDTSWHFNPEIWAGFGCIFPIFDTTIRNDTTVVIHDTCIAPVSIELMDIADNNAVVSWNGESGYLWELEVVREDMPWDSSISMITYLNFANVTNLDTAQWYLARVRTICDTNNKSLWTDSLRFYIPGRSDDTTATVVVQKPSTVDRFTQLMPNPAAGAVQVLSSFRMRNVAVYDISGKQMLDNAVDGISAAFNVEGWPSGVYMVVVTTVAGKSTKKLIVK